ncbi:phage integrase family protein [Dysgonomonas alginatilytica]|uniref:Phage integrase family protein n=1 Tax=Dysgonomonas alginatilytica TaxID=1605892 RepID=A0A2V3PMY6_9BACT|nr:tyrosine-type recombinase/integrase [Dysgonomonas alginatilytica]PXV62341.1 phage integrase family protein [Dysgonomonas alginatilytica]
MKRNRTKKQIDKFEVAFYNKYPDYSKATIKCLKTYNSGKNVDWDDFTKLFLIRFVSYLHTILSPNSVRTYCARIKSLLNDYVESVELPCRDFRKILSVKEVDTHNVYLTNEEIQKLIDYQPHNIRERVVRNQFVNSCLTGLRFSDVTELDETNIVENEILIMCRSQKTKNVVFTANNKITAKYILECVGHKYSAQTYNRTIREICKKVGINDIVRVIQAGIEIRGEKYRFITSHTARHSFATNLHKATRNLMLVCKCMGHSDVKQTQRYINMDDTNSAAVAEYASMFTFKNN